LIEDDRLDAELIEEMLGRRLEQSFDIEQVQRLSDGLARLETDEFDLILADLALPDSIGLETLKRLHKNTDTPILVLTGDNETDLPTLAVRQGADDYLAKEDLTSDTLVRAIRFALERHAHRRTEKELTRAQEQFRIIRRIQERLLPNIDVSIPGYDIAGTIYPAEHVSGDYCDVFSMPNGCVGFVVADVSGHGLSSSHLMLEARAAVRALVHQSVPLNNILTCLNELLFDDCLATGHFLTLFIGQLDPQLRQLEYASGGHMVYLIHPSGRLERLGSTGPALGLLRDRPVGSRRLPPLETGTVLVLPTDGIVETLSCEKILFGIERLRQFVVQNRLLSARALVDKLYQAARDFAGQQKQQDDITCIVVKIL